jgi:hypothetical protein
MYNAITNTRVTQTRVSAGQTVTALADALGNIPSKPTWHKSNWTLAIRGKTNSAQCMFHEKQVGEDKIQMFKMQHVVVCWHLLQDVPKKIAFLKNVRHYVGESTMQNVSKVIILLMYTACSVTAEKFDRSLHFLWIFMPKNLSQAWSWYVLSTTAENVL